MASEFWKTNSTGFPASATSWILSKNICSCSVPRRMTFTPSVEKDLRTGRLSSLGSFAASW
ncbi:MAG: hypothetical protein B9S33_02385 [Pedosphaera sp. Tous-C6FEB]|nr:MAG: hypothetical protein B9S33_02385 [Pedosphaera sp. Tous-C6FEB]